MFKAAITFIALVFLPALHSETLVLEPNNVTPIAHEPSHFTQGLLIHNGTVFETTGRYGQSRFYKYPPGGEPTSILSLNNRLFGEGLTLLNEYFYWLSWRGGMAWKISAIDYSVPQTFRYTGEGWGLTTDGKQLIMSNGSAKLSFREPNSFEIVHEIKVVRDKQPVTKLNELEWANGFIYANIWQSDEIVKIDPASGQVVATISAKKLRKHYEIPRKDVLNGIAFDRTKNQFLITGKNWPLALWVDLP